MADEIPVTPSPEEPPLKRLWTNIGKKNKDFTISYDEFAADMADEENVKSLHGNLPKIFPGYKESYEEFATNMGVKKKVGQAAGGNASGPGAAPEGLAGWTSSNDVGAEVGEDMPAGTPMSVPAEVPVAPTGAAEQMQQPLGITYPSEGSGQFDNEAEMQALYRAQSGQRPEEGRIAPRFPELTAESAATLARGRDAYALQQRLFADMVLGQRERDGAAANAINEELGLGGVADFGSSFYNALIPGGARALAAAADYADNLTALGGLQGPAMQAMQAAGVKPKLGVVEGLQNWAANNTAYVSPEGRKELSKNWTSPRAWSAALGSGAGSIAGIALTGATTGGAGAVLAGTAMGLDETGQAADAAGLTPGQKLAMQTVIAPVVGLLEEAGLGSVVANPVTRRLIGRSILAGAAGSLERSALVQSASRFAPKLVEVAGRVSKQALSEGGTEGLQTAVAEAYKLAFDEVQGNEGRKEGNGSFGTLENGLAAGVADAGRKALADAAVGGALGGLLGGAAGAPATQLTDTNVGQSADVPDTVVGDTAPLPEELPAAEPQPAPAVQGQPVAKLKSGATLLADFDENGTALRAYDEQGQEYSLEDPALRERVEQAFPQPTTPDANVQPTSPPTPEGNVSKETTPILENEAATPIAETQPVAGSDNVQALGETQSENTSDSTAGEKDSEYNEAKRLATVAQPLGRSLTPEQQAGNDVLDLLDDYKALNKTQRLGKTGQGFRKQMVEIAKKAGLNVVVAKDGTVKVDRNGKRATRVNTLSGTTEVDGHVPARQRKPEVRDAALTLADRVANGGGEFTTLGVKINSKNLNPRDAKAAALDIQQGRNTYRAQLLLDEIEASVERGYFAVSEGTGLATRKQEIPAEDFVGNPNPATIQSKQEVPLSDEELDNLIASDTKVQDAVNAYIQPDGSIDFQALADIARDPQGGAGGLMFMFDLDETTATKLLTLANERATQPQQPAASTPETQQTGPEPGGQAEGSPRPDGSDSGSQGRATTEERLTQIRADREAAIADFKKVLSGKKRSSVAYGTFLPIDPDMAVAAARILRTYVQEGVVRAEDILSRFRAEVGDEQETSLSDDDLRTLVATQLPPATPAPTPAAPEGAGTRTAQEGERKTVVNQLNNPALSEQRRAGLEQIVDYPPKPLSQSEQQADAAILGKTIAEAYAIALDPNEALPLDVRLLVRDKVANELDRLGVEAEQAGDDALAQQYIAQALTIDTEKALANTEYGRAINANRAITRYSPRQVVYQARKEVARQQQEAKKKLKSKGRAVAKVARAVQAEVVEATLKSEAVAQAKAKAGVTRNAAEVIKAIRETRASLWEQLRKLNGSMGIIDPAQQRAELHVKIFYTFMDEGVVRVKQLVKRFRDTGGSYAQGIPDRELQTQARQALASRATTPAAATALAPEAVRAGLPVLETTLDAIVRRHSSQQQQTSESLADLFVRDAGLTQAQADQLAAALDKEFQQQLAKRRESILNRLYAMRVRVGLGKKGKTALDKTLELLNLSPLSDSRVVGLLAEQTKLPDLTVRDVAALRKLAEAVETAPAGRDKEKAVRELNLFTQSIEGIKLLDLAQAMWYANVLSSYATHLVNFTANTYQAVMETLLATANATRAGKPSAPVRGLAQGLKAGAKLATEVLQTGYEPSGHHGKYDIPNTLEVAARNGNRLAGALKFVPRLLKASDVLYQTGLREMRAWELAVVEATKEGRQDPGRATWEAVYEKLGNSQARHQDALATATAEGRTGRDAALRVWELMEQSRPMPMQEDTRAYATRAVFNGEMEGSLGVIFSAVSGVVEKLGPVGKWVVPFSRVITNVANAYLDYTLHGFVRAAKGGIGFEKQGGQYRQYSQEERAKVLGKAMLGTALLAALYGATHRDKDEDNLEISGPGPRDSAQRNQLLQQGWRPYAVKLGSKWVSYKESPLFFVMGVVGAMKDHEQYEKANPETDDSYLSGASLLVFRTMGMVVETTATKNLSDALDAVTSSGGYGGETSGVKKFSTYLERTLAYSATGYLPGSGLLRQFSRDVQDFTDTDKVEAKRFWEVLQQDLPVFRSGLRPALDALGQPMKVQSDRLVSGRPSHRTPEVQHIWDVLTEKGVGVPVPNQRTTVAMTFQTEGKLPVTPAALQNPANWKEGPMSDETFYQFLQLRGEVMRGFLLLDIANFRSLSHDQAKERMAVLSKEATKRAKYMLVGAKWKDTDKVLFKGQR